MFKYKQEWREVEEERRKRNILLFFGVFMLYVSLIYREMQ